MTRLKPGTSSPTEDFRRHNKAAITTVPIRSTHPNDAPKGCGEANTGLNQDSGILSVKTFEETYHHEPHEPQVICEEGDTDSEPSKPRQHHVYINVTANWNARQINGDILSEDTVLAPVKNFYEGVVATEDSQQINGNVNDSGTLKVFFS